MYDFQGYLVLIPRFFTFGISGGGHLLVHSS